MKVYRRRLRGGGLDPYWSVRYQVRGRKIDHHVRPLTTSHRIALEAARREVTSGRNAGDLRTCTDVLYEYAEYLKANAPATHRSSAAALRWLQERLRGVRVAEARVSLAETLQAELLAGKGPSEAPLGPGTVARYMALIKAAFRRAERDERIPPGQPLARMTVGLRSPRRFVTWTEDELERVTRLLPPWAAAALWLARRSGRRISEVLALRWDHVQEDRLIFPPAKLSGDVRMVPLSTAARELLAGLKAAAGESPYVFPPVRSKRKPHRVYDELAHLVGRAKREAGVSGKTIHDLRRSFASSLFDKGVPRGIIAALLTHGDERSTGFYTAAEWETLAKAVEEA